MRERSGVTKREMISLLNSLKLEFVDP